MVDISLLNGACFIYIERHRIGVHNQKYKVEVLDKEAKGRVDSGMRLD